MQVQLRARTRACKSACTCLAHILAWLLLWQFAWPIEAKGGAHYPDDVDLPHELFARSIDEPVGGVDLAFFAVSFDHLEANPLAGVVDVGEVDTVRDGFVVYFDHEVGCGVGEGASEGPGVGLLIGGSPLLGLNLPVGDRELDWYFRE
eukprot:scaffold109_cov127-Isochrysis_galbana.AAC.2